MYTIPSFSVAVVIKYQRPILYTIPSFSVAVVIKYQSSMCIGSTKELCYQEWLATASQLINKGEVVLVKIKPELDNPVDSKATVNLRKYG